jgi:hypothetical protein
MKHKFNIWYLFVFAIFSLATSCKKDDYTSPQTGTFSPLYNAVLGKWNITTTVGRVTNNQSNISSKVQSPPQMVSIEFLTDSTYIVILNDGTVTTGTFKVTDSTSITLPNFGVLSDIKIADGDMDFKLQCNGTDIILYANQSNKIALTSDTKLLCRTWLLVPPEYGDSMYHYTKDNTVDRITILFSSAGTYLVQYFQKDTLVLANIANWKWHASRAMTIQFWWGNNEPTGDDDGVVTIEVLKSGALQLTQTLTANNVTYSDSYILMPYSHSSRISSSTMNTTTSGRKEGANGFLDR